MGDAMKRRDFITLAGMGVLDATLGHAVPAMAQTGTERKFSEWGWPQPYETISSASVAWLKGKGWWPLKLGSQPAFTSVPVGVPKGFFKARGIELEVLPFLSGPAINEAAAAGRIQCGMEGNLPFTSLIANNASVRSIAVANPNLKHATLVPLDSPLKRLDDLKGMSSKPAFGIVAGSSAEFYFQEALRAHGMEVGKDVIVKNMTPPDMLLMPQGLTGVVQWQPYVWDQLEVRKNAREIDSIFPYNFYMGNVWMRKEIIDHAPDVAQAMMDAYVEGILYTRYNAGDAIKITEQDPMHKRFPPEIVARIVSRLNNDYKPTWFYPFREFWSQENARVAAWLSKTGRLSRLVTAELYDSYFDSRFADKTLAKLGWAVPRVPPWIPAGWSGTLGHVPYPTYFTEDDLAQPQRFPAPEDLVKPWYFGGRTYEAR